MYLDWKLFGAGPISLFCDLVHDSSAHRHYAVQTVEITGPDSELTYSGINQESVKPRSVQSGVRSESKF